MKLSEWREVAKMPVVCQFYLLWNVSTLEIIFLNYIKLCVEKNLLENKGVICTTLSGGVDSSLCLAMIRKIVGWDIPIHTFTTGKNEKHPDIVLARLVAGQFMTEHHELLPSERLIENARKKVHSFWPKETESPGNVAVYLTQKHIQSFGFKSLIAHDGIDELMGGYWDHRKQKNTMDQEKVFKLLWSRLETDHLLHLEQKANKFGISVLLPYLQSGVVNYVSRIPVWHRTNRKESKIPLKAVARRYLPPEIVDRKKIGFCDALSTSI